MGMFSGILFVSHNTIMDMNNAMFGFKYMSMLLYKNQYSYILTLKLFISTLATRLLLIEYLLSCTDMK